jgi:hypothetical protein
MLISNRPAAPIPPPTHILTNSIADASAASLDEGVRQGEERGPSEVHPAVPGPSTVPSTKSSISPGSTSARVIAWPSAWAISVGDRVSFRAPR